MSYFGDTVLPGLKPHYREFDRVSDDLGCFSVEGDNGLALDLKIQPKPGYQFRPVGLQVMLRDEGVGKPAPTISTRESPYVFHAFKHGQKVEGMSKGAIAFYDLVPDGRPYIVKLRSNRVVVGTTDGDFRISVKRPPGWANQTDFDWSVQIDGVDMELQETHDEFASEAPASGYGLIWGFAQKAGTTGYVREVNPKFYLKSRAGVQFGRIEVQFIADYRDGAGLIVHYWLNSSGSRNLE
ncbi:MAG: hypothetical protein IPL39_04035 [Opitutaceae bacterium]|nr:hypothetical protein [Opitutaceae bacterium]